MVREPAKATLRKYGLTCAAWYTMADGQNWVCKLCGRVPKSGRLAIDHEHVRGWKKLPPQERVKHVRGLLCMLPCNRYYVGKLTLAMAEKVVLYLRAHHEKAKQGTAGQA